MIQRTAQCRAVSLRLRRLPIGVPLAASRHDVLPVTAVQVGLGVRLIELKAAADELLFDDERNLIRAKWGLPPLPADLVSMLGGPDVIVAPGLFAEIAFPKTLSR